MSETNSISVGGNVSGGVLVAGAGARVEIGTMPSASAQEQLRKWSGSSVFISHAHDDADLVLGFVQLLLDTTSLGPSDIFCSSLSGSGIPEGRNFVDYIRRALVNASLVVPMITRRYLGSGFCMCELGAAWALELRTFPFLAGAIRLDELTGVLGQVQVARVEDANALDRLRQELGVVDGVTLDDTNWPALRDRFVSTAHDPDASSNR